MTPDGLLQHLNSNNGCVYHRFMINYLEVYFCKYKGDYLGLDNVGHYSFYGKSDEKRKKSFDNEQESIIFKHEEEKRRKQLLEQKEAKK